MTIAYYTVDLDRFHNSKSYIVRIYKNDEVIKTVNFPISNPYFPSKTYELADEFGRSSVREIMNRI